MAAQSLSSQPQHQSLVIIDSEVRNPEVFLSGLPAGARGFVLRREQDPIAQIADIARRYGGLANISIISHATPGKISLGGADYDAQSLRQHGGEFAAIARSLAPGGDILLFGCDLASGDDGKSLVRTLSELTGRDVAASTNATGAEALGGDWVLEMQTGAVETAAFVTPGLAAAWNDLLVITVTTATSAVNMRNAQGAPGTNGVTYSGTPALNAAVGTNAFGTFTTTGNLGIARGAMLGTGNINQVPGAPGTFWDGAGTGVTSGVERDIASLTFQFAPNPGVTKIVFEMVMGSEEYNEYVGQNFSDNIRVLLNGGVYANQNFAVVPGTATGIDIDTINATLNSSFYRDNTVAGPPVPDSVLDGHTTVIRNVTAVVPGTTYTVTQSIADYTDNRWNSAAFFGYFGSSIFLDLDGNNSSGATGTAYNTTFTEGGAAVSVADTDRIVRNYDTTNIQSATITLTNAQASDLLTIGALPGGITGVVNTSTPGVITVTLTGSTTSANYQTAINAVTFSNPSGVPNTTPRNVTVVVNDGVTNSNTAVTTITVTPILNTGFLLNKTASVANRTTPGLITYTITVVNNGDVAMTGTTFSDALLQGVTAKTLTSGPTKVSGDTVAPGTLNIGETWTYTATYNVTQADIDNGGTFSNTFTFDTAQTAASVSNAATTTITRTPNMTVVKSANSAGPLVAGQALIFSFLVTNTGNVTLSGVAIQETAFNGTGGIAAIVPGGGSASLAPGATTTFTANYIVTQNDVDTLQ